MPVCNAHVIQAEDKVNETSKWSGGLERGESRCRGGHNIVDVWINAYATDGKV